MPYALGVDLGTTYTAAAVMRDRRADIVPLGNHAATIPTMVFLREDEGLLIGDAAERRGVHEPARLAREFKRRLGDTTPIMLDRTPFSAERLLAVILADIVGQVTKRQGAPADVVAVSHPANWGGYKLDLLRQAVQLAGVDDATYITEPIAAAVQYAASERVDPGAVIAVYDLGGGTFDAAVLRKTETGFETLGRPNGIERLGGIDFDEAVLTHVRTVLGGALDAPELAEAGGRAALSRLRQECVLAKESLSSDSDATVPVLLPNLQTQVRITRAEFEDMIRPILRETVASARRAIESAGVPIAEVSAILLAGGSSRIPLVGEMVAAEFGRPVVTDTHPKHAVALGAARFGAQQLVADAATVPTLPGVVVAADGHDPRSLADSQTAPVPVMTAAPPATGGVVSPPRPPGPPGAPAAPRRAGMVAAAVLAALALAGGGLALSRRGDSSASGPATVPTGGTGPVVSVPLGSTPPGSIPPVTVVLPATTARSQPTTQPTTRHTTAPTTAPTTATTSPSSWPTTVTTTSGTATSGTATSGTSLATSPPTSPASMTSTTMASPGLRCGKAGRCAGIRSIEVVDGVYRVTYRFDGFTPKISNSSKNRHVHFFYDTVPAEQAGHPGRGPWFIWDLAKGNGEPVFDEMRLDRQGEDGGAGATGICVAVADRTHAIELDTVSCAAIPVG